MPTGRVRFFDADKGFGFITKDDGGDVYVRANALPTGVTALKAGQRVEFGVIEGRRGEQALSPRHRQEASTKARQASARM